MAPKASVKSKAKPKEGKKKGLTVKRNPVLAAPKQKTCGGGATSKADSRLLSRRNTDEQVDRAVRLKLHMFSPTQIKNHRDAEGRSIDEVVRAAVKSSRSTKKHLSVVFWSDLIKNFGLVGGVVDNLPPPEEEETVNKELDASMRVAHCANPAARSPLRLLQFLKFFGPCNRTEFFGLCKGCFESPSCSRTMSRQLLDGLLRYIARVGADKQHPDYWDILSNHFDLQLAAAWQLAQSTRVSRSCFLRSMREPMSLFMDMELATEIEQKCNDSEEPLAPQIEKMMRCGLVAQELYAPEAQKIEITNYVGDVARRLYEVEMNDFGEEHVLDFKRLCMHMAANLDNEVWQQFDHRKIEVPYLSISVGTIGANPNDEWSTMYESRVKSLAVSGTKLPRFPWEQHLYGSTAPLEGYPETIDLPEEVIFDMHNAREHMLKMLGNGWMSVEQMKKVMRTHGDEAKKMDGSWWLDEAFLFEQYDDLIASHLQECMLGVLPQVGERRNMKTALTAARTLLVGDVVQAQTKKLKKEMEAAMSLLNDLVEARGPMASEAGKYGSFLLQFLKRCENFAIATLTEDGEEIDENLMSVKNSFFGHEAVTKQFERCSRKMSVQEGKDLKFFKTFRWCLNAEQETTFVAWQKEAVETAKDRIAEQKLKALTDEEKTTITDTKRKSLTVSCIDVAPPLEKKQKTLSMKAAPIQNLASAFEEQEALSSCGSNGLISFFGSKAL